MSVLCIKTRRPISCHFVSRDPVTYVYSVVPGTDRIDRSSRPISRKVESTEKLSAIDRYFVESIEIFKSRVDRFTDDWSTIFRKFSTILLSFLSIQNSDYNWLGCSLPLLAFQIGTSHITNLSAVTNT